ncbi:MAG: hypothetical protein ACOX2D_13665 [Fermentimonas sp.]|jgi:hypothetical protein
MKKSCYLLLACLFVGMSACISLDIDVELEPVKDLVLSVGNNGHVSTDGLSYEFEVLDGNGFAKYPHLSRIPYASGLRRFIGRGRLLRDGQHLLWRGAV